MSYPATAVLEHCLVSLRRTWRGSVFSSFLLPVLYLFGMGFTVGAYVDRGGQLGVAYGTYVAPGLLASTALQIAINESTFPVLGSFEWHRSYHAMRATSLRVTDILVGHLSYVLLRVLTSALGFIVVMLAFGTVESVWGFAVLPITLLLGAAGAAPIFAYSASIHSDKFFAVLYRFAVIPMTLFSGVFFPVQNLPVVARWLAYLSPLWHGVELCRGATLGVGSLAAAGHIGYLALWAALGYLLARRQFRRRLSD